ncbi:MAG TPA: DUF885 domain-containing protein [Thermoanaerobaculia bacterium]|nr:DUF885 domain-containing protein [Thermoanaerobaculia bacterium]
MSTLRAPRRRRPSLISAALAVVVCAAPLPVATAAEAPPDPQLTSRLHDLVQREWEHRLREDPLLATSVGRHDYDERLPQVGAEDWARRAAADRAFLAQLREIPSDHLAPADGTTHAMLVRELEDRLADHRFGAWQMPINADSGFHMGLARLPEEVPLQVVPDYEAYLARLRALPRYFEQQTAALTAGLERGFTVPQVTLEGYDATVAAHVVDDPTRSVFWAPFADFPVGVPEAARERLRQQGRAAIAEAAAPAYRGFLEFLRDVYIPGARRSIAAVELPEGRDYYAHLVRHFTTLELTFEEVHALGQREVARIEGEMRQVMAQVDFAGTLPELFERMRSDPRFYVDDPEELLRHAARIAKRMDGELPRFFGRLPRLPYGVEPVPPHIAPKYTAGRYVPAPVGSTRAGTYWVNTANLPSRPLYALEALTLHEAVPGHHLQIALAQELEGLPEFRRHGYLSAFGEGWGLYSEWLGKEAGFYTDPWSELGRLSYEMWRAARLVVDTGMHALGWSRQQALDFMAAKTALSRHEIGTEVDRYISWPGQALAYKIGELEIRRLRRQAEEALGAAFDVRELHDVVLSQGSVPLPVLAANVAAWIAAERAAEE